MKTLLIQMVQTATEVMRLFEQQIGMSQTRLEVLTALLQEDEVTQAVLQQQLGVDGATITRRVKQLEGEGLLTRRMNPQDNRFTLVKLTHEGRRVLIELSAARENIETLALQGLEEEERDKMYAMLERIRQNMRQMHS